MTTPTLGDTVFYTLTKEVAKSQNRRRVDAVSRHQYNAFTGVQTHTGNLLVEGDVYPMLVTRVWKDKSVNGQVFLDGNDAIWVTSVKEGKEPGTFSLSDNSEPLENPESPPEKTPLKQTETKTVVKSTPAKQIASKPTVAKTAVKSTPSKQTASKTASKPNHR